MGRHHHHHHHPSSLHHSHHSSHHHHTPSHSSSTSSSHFSKPPTKKIGWLRHVLTALSVIIFVTGLFLLGYMTWVLSTSGTIGRFFSGTLVFTYCLLGVGFTLFFSGLLGWVAGASERPCILKMFIVTVALVMLSEIGCIVTLNLLDIQMDDVLINGWAEVNEGTRNMVQSALNCCGYYGHKEFAYTSYPIDDSCYEQRSDEEGAPYTLKQNGCGALLHASFSDYKVVWCSLLAVVGGLQLMSIVLAIHVVRKLKDKSSRSSSLRQLADHHYNYAYSL